MFDSDNFVSKWITIKPCDDDEADYILMKICMQKKKCKTCTRCIGEMCDVYTTIEAEARLGKYLIEQEVKQFN